MSRKHERAPSPCFCGFSATQAAIPAPGPTSRLLLRLPLRFEEVTWNSDGATIAGTLVLSAGDGPLRVPVVALWGEFDLNVDPQVNRAIFEVALDAARSRDHTLLRRAGRRP